MKKTNKILAKALVIILSLVLITSSVVSSTFAKYVVAKSAETKVSLQKFGLTVTLKGDGTEAVKSQAGDSITLEYTGITLKPGDPQYKDAIRASIEGKASVDAKLYITVSITCDDTRYTLSKNDFTTLKEVENANKVCNPIAFYVGNSTTSEPVNEAYTYYDVADNDAKNSIKTNIEDLLGTQIATNANAITGISVGSTGGAISGTIEAGKSINLNNIGVGFAWETPAVSNETNLYDEITTWISDRGNAEGTTQFTITYTISVEQDTTASN